MNRRHVILGTTAWLLAGSLVWATDLVKTTTSTIPGQIKSMNALEVTVDRSGVERIIPINEIVSISFEGEPALLKTARTAILAGRYEDAIEALENVNPSDIVRTEIKQDIGFHKALAAARLALAKRDVGGIEQAGRGMLPFANDTYGYHHLEACEVLGDTLVAAGKHEAALPFYGRLAKAPWPDYQMRAGVAIGKAQLAAGNASEAKTSFEKVLAMKATSPTAEQQHLAATLGTARCLSAEKEFDSAIEAVESVIARTNPEQSRLNAQAYNTLGITQRQAGRPKEALLAFLHVDVLYFNVPGEHIEALENLVDLWNEVDQPDRASAAVRTLADRYKRSP